MAENDKPPVDPPGKGNSSSEPPPILHVKFAVGAGIITALVTLAFLIGFGIFGGRVGLSADEWNALEAPAKFAARVTIPIAGLGILLLLVGTWMAVVEWAGRFKVEEREKAPQEKASEIPEVITAIGKLRGAALVMIVGALLMLSAAWVAQSAARPPAVPATDETTP